MPPQSKSSQCLHTLRATPRTKRQGAKLRQQAHQQHDSRRTYSILQSSTSSSSRTPLTAGIAGHVATATATAPCAPLATSSLVTHSRFLTTSSISISISHPSWVSKDSPGTGVPAWGKRGKPQALALALGLRLQLLPSFPDFLCPSSPFPFPFLFTLPAALCPCGITHARARALPVATGALRH